MDARQAIDEMCAKFPDWRGDAMTQLRTAILAVDPGIHEEWKYMGAPVWELDGILCVGNIFKDSVKLGFMYGASLPDPHRLFNDELAGNQRRAIKLREGDGVDEDALKELVRAAIGFNRAKRKK